MHIRNNSSSVSLKHPQIEKEKARKGVKDQEEVRASEKRTHAQSGRRRECEEMSGHW